MANSKAGKSEQVNTGPMFRVLFYADKDLVKDFDLLCKMRSENKNKEFTRKDGMTELMQKMVDKNRKQIDAYKRLNS